MEINRTNPYFLTKTKHDDKIMEISKFQKKHIDLFTLIGELAKKQFEEERKKAKNPEKWLQEKEQKKYQKMIEKARKKIIKFIIIESEKHVETSSPAEQAGLWFMDALNDTTLYVEFLVNTFQNDPFPNVKKLARMYVDQTVMLFMVTKKNFESMLKKETLPKNKEILSDIISTLDGSIPKFKQTE